MKVFRKIALGMSIIVGLTLMLSVNAIHLFNNDDNYITNFIKKHPEKSAIKVVRNDSVLVCLNADKMMPLASTVKIIIAIEYAEQASNGKIDPNQRISLNELHAFYVPRTDGNAHPNWLKAVKDKIEDNKVTIQDIAKGMIQNSSNANTEWLSYRLGLDHINNRLDSLGIKHHDDIYYIVSSLFIGKEKFPNLKGKALEEQLRQVSKKEYIQITEEIHEKLVSDSLYKKDIGDLRQNIQKIWSDNLPSSTANVYATLMKKLNSKSYFSSETHNYLDVYSRANRSMILSNRVII